MSPALAGGFFTTEPPGKQQCLWRGFSQKQAWGKDSGIGSLGGNALRKNIKGSEEARLGEEGSQYTGPL